MANPMLRHVPISAFLLRTRDEVFHLTNWNLFLGDFNKWTPQIPARRAELAWDWLFAPALCSNMGAKFGWKVPWEKVVHFTLRCPCSDFQLFLLGQKESRETLSPCSPSALTRIRRLPSVETLHSKVSTEGNLLTNPWLGTVQSIGYDKEGSSH